MEAAKLSSNKLALLEKYRQRHGRHEQQPAITIQKRQPEAVIPLSFGQQQMWLLAQLIPDVPVYNESVTIRLPGPLDAAALEQSLNEVIKRHEVWRTTFPFVDGQPVQVVHPSLRLEVPFFDLRHLPLSEREPRAIQIATERALPFFDLTKLPLLRAILIQLDDENHRLYLTLHHILFDGVIYEVFLPELYAHYQAFAAGEPSLLPPLPVQYGDFAIWQRERLQTKELAAQMAYWKKQLFQAPVSLELPTDHPHLEVQSHRGARLPFSLPANLVDALKSFSRQENSTLYQTLVASFNTLLYRYTGQTDLLIGTTTGGNRPQMTHDLLGLFLNPLVLRTDLSGNPTFRELLQRVRDVVLEAHANQDVPFEYLVSALQPKRNLRQSPFIQVMLSLEPPLPILPSGWTITQSDVEPKTAKFDLYLELDDRPDGFAAWLEYNTDIFEEATAWRMIRHWQMLLQSIALDPSMRLADLPLLTPAEEQALLIEWNDTALKYPQNCCFHQLFEAQVARTPDAIAAIFAKQRLTYQELNAKANQLARYLQLQGVGAEALVGISVERSLDMLVALLGILKAGGAYVPLDPNFPGERLAYIIENARIKILLTQQELSQQLPVSEQMRIICIDSDRPQFAHQDISNLDWPVEPGQIAYVLYTSGSTGQPKGVQISQRALTNFLCSMQRKPGLSAEDSLLAVTTLSFDIAGLELFLPLLVGARVVIASRDTAADGRALARVLKDLQITLLQATPVTWRLLIDSGWTGKADLTALCGGEALPRDLAVQLIPRVRALYNMYGPTETTIWSTLSHVTSTTGPISIGRPIDNTLLYVLDTNMQPVPVGVPGELYIGGDSVASGYLYRPELTQERFLPNPFMKTAVPAPIYRTGDLVRYRPDGNLEHLGRLDHQVKLRGYRIELGEIETVLKQLPEIHETVVVAREDVPGDKRLIAYVTAEQGQSITVDTLVQYLKEHLPYYMLPSAYVQLETLPVSPSGKIDRLALPAPDASGMVDEANYVSPMSLVQDSLQEIWEELLNTKPIGIKDNFFLVGGNSLMAAQLIIKIERASGKQISLPMLFANPTIERLSEALKKQEDKAGNCLIIEVQPGKKSRTPLFFFHGDPNDGSFYCFKLARSLGNDQPFYACAPYRLAEGEPITSFEEIAAAHLASIRAIQPEGPYQIGGFCNGGLVAYEIARQLQAEHQKVDLLFLVDPSPGGYRKNMRAVFNGLSKALRMPREMQANLFLRLHYVYRYLRFSEDRQHFREQRAIFNNQLNKLSLLQALLPPPVEELRKDWLELFRWVISDYTASSPYTGKVTFVWTDGVTDQKIWASTPEVKFGDVYSLPSGHVDWVRSHLDVLAQFLKSSLPDSQNASRNDL